MTQELAEKKIRGLQKEILTRMEDHEVFRVLSPDSFNAVRRRVFRGTFDAYRLGVVGLASVKEPDVLYASFFGWADEVQPALSPTLYDQMVDMCFGTALEAFRIGAMVSTTRG